jgi:hypothetical protein
MGKLTAMRIKAIREPGRYTDGDGLMLVVSASGRGSWILRVTIEGRRKDIGIGALALVTLAEAREKAIDYRRLIAQGIDPVAERKRIADPVPTFEKAAHQVHHEHKAIWKEGKHQNQWINTLETYAFPILGDRPVDQIEGPLIQKVLRPIWISKPETARRVRQRVCAVLDWSYARGCSPSAPMAQI